LGGVAGIAGSGPVGLLVTAEVIDLTRPSALGGVFKLLLLLLAPLDGSGFSWKAKKMLENIKIFVTF
jgi:hypothetical protein